MSIYISKKLRKEVAQRAGFRCEYCHLLEEDSFLDFVIEHIIAIKHGGGNEIGNLAYSCQPCNRYKGSDLTTFLGTYENII